MGLPGGTRRFGTACVLGAVILVVGAAIAWARSDWGGGVRIAVALGALVGAVCVATAVINGMDSFLADAGWAWAVVLIWAGSWILMWLDRANESMNFVDEPAAVALSLGAIAITIFCAIYLRPDSKGGGMRQAIAATFVVLFLLLVVDLLTIPGFRGSLTDVRDVEVSANGTSTSSIITTENCPAPTDATPTGLSGAIPPSESPSASPTPCPPPTKVAVSFVEGLFGAFKWALTAIIIFYFGTEAISKFAEEKTKQASLAAGLTAEGGTRPDVQPQVEPATPGAEAKGATTTPDDVGEEG